MRILVSTGIFPNEVDPTRGVYIYKQVEALQRRCDVGVVAPVAKYPPGLGRSSVPVPERSNLNGLVVYHPRYLVTPKLRFLHGRAVIRGSASCHARLIAELRPDILLTFFAYPYGYAGVEIARRYGIPSLVGVLGSDVNVKARHRLVRPLIRRTFERAARVLSVSAALGHEVEEMGIDPARIVVIPNGVDAVRFTPLERGEVRERLGLDATARVVTCVSRLSREKGIDVLVRAVARMRTTGLAVKVVGEGPERSALEALARRLDVSDRIEFAGRMPHDEVPLWINAADVAVLPSRIEGHPNAVVEALACGRPVVATRVGGVAEAITSKALGRLVEPDDPEGLASALDEALSLEWDTDRLVAAGAGRTWDTVAGEIIDVIDRVLTETA